MISDAFAQYVSPHIVKELIAHPEKLTLGGERRNITLMFTDLAGFTAMSETREPEEVAALLNRHFTLMTRTIIDHGGTIDKFIVDAIMAFWGAPLDDDDQAIHVCEAAIQMQRHIDTLNEELLEDGLPTISMRIGIHAGIAVVGNLGSVDRFDYTAIGDNVNMTARLEGINKLYGTGILISEPTDQALPDTPSRVPIDMVKFKGKTQPLCIFTFEENPVFRQQLEAAVKAFRQLNWNKAEKLWKQLKETDKYRELSMEYLRRIQNFRQTTLPDDWDGAEALEKM